MSSDEIDSTTTATTVAAIYQHDDAAAALAFNSLESEDQADHFRVNDMLTSSASTNGQKRKLSQDAFPGDEHSNVDELKKQRTNESDPVASTIENPSHSPPHAGENANSSGNEATGAVVVSVPVNEIVVKQEVKDEPQDDNEAASGEAQSTSGLNGNISVKREFKVEPKVEIVTTEEATSSIRDSCQFGIRCYREEEDTTSPTPSKKQWTTEDIDIMLQMVKERPVIWQVDYSDRTSRPNAFLEIEKVLGFPALEIKRKLHNMRCTFRNQYKSALLTNKQVKWRFYDAMKFMYTSSALTNDGADFWDDDLPAKKTEQKIVVPWKKRIREPHNNNSKHHHIPTDTEKPAIVNSSPTIIIYPNFEEDKTDCNQYHQPHDDCGAFGDYVADTIRNLPADLKELAKRQITHLLFDITAHTDARQSCNLSTSILENDSHTIVMDTTTNVSYPNVESVYGTYHQPTVLNETREIQLGLHEF